MKEKRKLPLQKQFEWKRIRFKRNSFFVHILSSISHAEVCLPQSQVTPPLWQFVQLQWKQKLTYWNMKQKHLAWRLHTNVNVQVWLHHVDFCPFFLRTAFTKSVQRVAHAVRFLYVHAQQLLHSKSSWLSQNSRAKTWSSSTGCLNRRRARTSDSDIK